VILDGDGSEAGTPEGDIVNCPGGLGKREGRVTTQDHHPTLAIHDVPASTPREEPRLLHFNYESDTLDLC
jgi:hypothetical protein